MSPAIVKISPSTSVPVRVVSSNEIEVAPTAVLDATNAALLEPSESVPPVKSVRPD